MLPTLRYLSKLDFYMNGMIPKNLLNTTVFVHAGNGYVVKSSPDARMAYVCDSQAGQSINESTLPYHLSFNGQPLSTVTLCLSWMRTVAMLE